MIEIEFYIGLLAAGITLFINYCIGSPASEKFSPYEIFSSYTFWLSKRRLKQVDLWTTYSKQYSESLLTTQSRAVRISIQNDFKKMVYDAADPFFTWERAAGMCPVCTGFWIALITFLVNNLLAGIRLSNYNLLHLVIIIVVSHITIRILNKIL